MLHPISNLASVFRFSHWHRISICGPFLAVVIATSFGNLVLSQTATEPTSDSANSSKLEKLAQWAHSTPGTETPIPTELAEVSLDRLESKTALDTLWALRLQQLRSERKAEFEAKKIEIDNREMKFDYKLFGEAPATGRNLFISMHGGGGAPKQVNDQQWRNQIRLYKPEEGVYLAPRAPTDTWNLWHEGHIDGMFAHLIEDCVAFENVNPDRVYLLGYSAGGDGVYQVAPRMADFFAAASMMAGHPNESTADSLRNLPFALHMGEKDAAYNRNEVAKKWAESLEKLHAADPTGYTHFFKLHTGKGHWMDGDDAEAVPWMTQYTRNFWPKKIVWKQDDVVHSRFYWLGVPKASAKAGVRIEAEIESNRIKLTLSEPLPVELYLSDELVDLDQSIEVEINGKLVHSGKVERKLGTLYQSLLERADQSSAYSAKLVLPQP